MGAGVFEFVHDHNVGDVYIIADAAAPPPRLRGPIGGRRCDEDVDARLEWADVPSAAAGNHYSGRWCMQKLELLAHLPPSVQHAVLLDADTYVTREGLRLLGEHIHSLEAPQFVAASRTAFSICSRVFVSPNTDSFSDCGGAGGGWTTSGAISSSRCMHASSCLTRERRPSFL